MERVGKKQKVQHDMKQFSFLFGNLPEEMVLSILSYGTIKDIQNTRLWQTEKVKECTTTTTMIEAAKNETSTR